jgi:hypothetical protein
MPYNRELVGLDEVEAFGRRLVGIDSGGQLCVLDYFPPSAGRGCVALARRR